VCAEHILGDNVYITKWNWKFSQNQPSVS